MTRFIKQSTTSNLQINLELSLNWYISMYFTGILTNSKPHITGRVVFKIDVHEYMFIIAFYNYVIRDRC